MMNNLLFLFCSFILKGVSAAAADVTVSVMERDSVTLHTYPDEIKGADALVWNVGDRIIAKLDIEGKTKPEYPDETLRSRLTMHHHTGSLTITNITSEDSKEYELQIRGSRETKKTFRVDLNDEMQTESVLEGEVVILHTNTEKQTDDVIMWTFKDTVIAQFNRTANNFSYDSNGRFKDRLTLDRGGSLTIRKTKTEDSGHYDVNLNNSRNFIHRRFNVRVTELNANWYKPAFWIVLAVLGIIVLGLSSYKIHEYRRKTNRLATNEKIETSQPLNQSSSNTNGTMDTQKSI